MNQDVRPDRSKPYYKVRGDAEIGNGSNRINGVFAVGADDVEEEAIDLFVPEDIEDAEKVSEHLDDSDETQDIPEEVGNSCPKRRFGDPTAEEIERAYNELR